jgi:DNA primase small subunit
MKPVAKELVFDIDMTDYDDVRTCCSKANICHKCWSFITMAIKVVDTALREDFGFEHILWVYSGRRGAHAWVGDHRARNLPDDRRKAIAGYLELVKGNDKSGKRVNVKRPLHPHVARSVKLLEPHFNQTTLIDQDVFLGEKQAERLLGLLPDKKLSDALRRKWDSTPDRSSTNKWNDIVTLAKTVTGIDARALKDARYDIVLEYTYPRLDAEVSKKMIHLLKSPFVIHPGTGRVCVPMDGRTIEEFDPLAVPTVTELLTEIDEYDRENPPSASNLENGPSDRKMQDYEKTRLKPYVDYFRSFVANLIKDERPVKRERGAEETTNDAMEF